MCIRDRYSYEGDNIGQGRDNTITWLEENSDAKEAIEKLVRQKLTEGSEVSSNSMRPLAVAAPTESKTPVMSKVVSSAA